MRWAAHVVRMGKKRISIGFVEKATKKEITRKTKAQVR
jgi:hypothetical protein